MERSLECETLGPRVVTSRRRVQYRRSSWRVHSFEVWCGGGERVCRAAALRMQGSLLLWLGAGAGEPALGDLALGVPGGERRVAAASTLLGAGAEESAAGGLARRLAAALERPVFVCCGAAFDRFTLPLVERGLISEIKNRPECF